MNNNHFKEILNIPKAVKIIALATLISNIGNGMHLIAVSKLAYDKTNSAMAFGGVIVLQYVVMFLVQFISGAVVDKNNPKKIIVISDLARGTLILTSGLMCLFSEIGIYYLFVSLLIVNIINPFFSTANFCILPEVLEDKEMLLKSNGIITTLFQAGQLCGSAGVAAIIYFFNPAVALIIDGLTYYASALIFSFVPLEKKSVYNNLKVKNEFNIISIIKDFVNDWKAIWKCIRKEKSAIGHLVLSSGDYISVNLFNVMLIPMVTHFYNNNSFNISLFDCGFAIGSMLAVFIIGILSQKIGKNNSAVIGILLQGLILIIVSMKINRIFTFLLMILYGVSNSFSITIYSTNLQKRCEGNIKGKINSIKNFIVSCLTIIIIPIVSRMYDVSIECGLLVSSGILLAYALISFIIGRNIIFGTDFLTKTLTLEETSVDI